MRVWGDGDGAIGLYKLFFSFFSFNITVIIKVLVDMANGLVR